MKTFYLKPVISAPKNEKLIYVARNGQGYFANNELHLQGELHHYFYQFTGNNKGWYMRNQFTKTDYYLGLGASPSLMLEEYDIKDVEYWESITYDPEVNEEADTPIEN